MQPLTCENVSQEPFFSCIELTLRCTNVTSHSYYKIFEDLICIDNFTVGHVHFSTILICQVSFQARKHVIYI